jgi:hypothetical protein
MGRINETLNNLRDWRRRRTLRRALSALETLEQCNKELESQLVSNLVRKLDAEIMGMCERELEDCCPFHCVVWEVGEG